MVKFMNEFREFPKISRILKKMKFSEIAVILPPPHPFHFSRFMWSRETIRGFAISFGAEGTEEMVKSRIYS